MLLRALVSYAPVPSSDMVVFTSFQILLKILWARVAGLVDVFLSPRFLAISPKKKPLDLILGGCVTVTIHCASHFATNREKSPIGILQGHEASNSDVAVCW